MCDYDKQHSVYHICSNTEFSQHLFVTLSAHSIDISINVSIVYFFFLNRKSICLDKLLEF